MGEPYSNIRDHLGPLIGKKLVDVTQHDQEDFEANGECFVLLMFEDGSTVKFPVGDDPFIIEGPAAADDLGDTA